ncbi:hypothetical protein GOP47_0002455, partial [Adiantum capillus-veneris]
GRGRDARAIGPAAVHTRYQHSPDSEKPTKRRESAWEFVRKSWKATEKGDELGAHTSSINNFMGESTVQQEFSFTAEWRSSGMRELFAHDFDCN